jgi:hypothetical protein
VLLLLAVGDHCFVQLQHTAGNPVVPPDASAASCLQDLNLNPTAADAVWWVLLRAQPGLTHLHLLMLMLLVMLRMMLLLLRLLLLLQMVMQLPLLPSAP